MKPLIDLGSSGFGLANLTWAGLAEKALASERNRPQRSSDKNSYRAIEGGLALGIDYITGSADFNSYAYESTFDDFKTLDPTVTPICLALPRSGLALKIMSRNLFRVMPTQSLTRISIVILIHMSIQLLIHGEKLHLIMMQPFQWTSRPFLNSLIKTVFWRQHSDKQLINYVK